MSNARELADLTSSDPSTDPNIDNGTLFIERLTNRVGINNSSPNATLDVTGSIVSSATIAGTTFDTNVDAAAVTLSGTTLAADGTDPNIDINITPKGTGVLSVGGGGISGVPPSTRSIDTGYGLVGGGDLSSDRTISLSESVSKTLGAVNTSTNRITVTSHTISTGSPAVLSGQIPSGTTAGQVYWVREIDANTIELYTTQAYAYDTDNTTGIVNLTNTTTGGTITVYGLVGNMTGVLTGSVKLNYGTQQSTTAQAVTTTTNRTYAIQNDSNGQLVVNVPWADTNTTYTVGTGLSLSSNQINFNSTYLKASTSAAALGYSALGYQAQNNIGIGFYNLGSVSSGSNNIAIGSSCLNNNVTSATNNIAIGVDVMGTVGAGTYSNIAIGEMALHYVGNFSHDNVAIGKDAMSDVTGAYSNNICIGTEAGTVYSVYKIASNNNIVLGNGSISKFYCKVGTITTSDIRDKNITGAVEHGLEFIKNLNPIRFFFKKSREDSTNHGPERYGFSAQEVLELEGDNPIIIDNEEPENLKMSESMLLPVLVNAIKEQQEIIDSQQKQIDALTARLDAAGL